MSYFSIVELDPNAWTAPTYRADLQKLTRIGSVYRDHCLLMKLFPAWQARYDGSTQEERSSDILFHRRKAASSASTTAGDSTGRLSWYVVSRERPEAVEGLLRLPHLPKLYSPKLEIGETVRFELRANPSVTRSRGLGVAGPNAGKRRPHKDVLQVARETSPQRSAEEIAGAVDEAATGWLLGRAESLGLRIDPGSLLTDGYTRHEVRRGRQAIRFSSIDYTGVATVLDPERLSASLLGGVGRKRGFGCGLLLVKRIA